MHCCFFYFRQGQYVTGIHEYFSTFEYVVHWYYCTCVIIHEHCFTTARRIYDELKFLSYRW